MAIDWNTTPHYTLNFTASGEAELTDPNGTPHEAFNAASSRSLRLTPDGAPQLSLLTVIDL